MKTTAVPSDTSDAPTQSTVEELKARIGVLESELVSQRDRYLNQIEKLEQQCRVCELKERQLKKLVADLQWRCEGSVFLSERSTKQQDSTLLSSSPSLTDRIPLIHPVSELSADQIQRYSRQLLLSDGFGVEGQRKLLSSSVLVIGAGGIGSTVLLYLAASGVGHVTVVDFDRVEMSNLHRQIIHKEMHVGLNKAVSACLAMKHLNPTLSCVPVQEMLTPENALEIVRGHDCVVDASDNAQTRYCINDACVLAGKPLVSGSAIGTEGQLTVYNHFGGPCYRCLYPKPDATEGCKSCSDNGVLGPVPGLIGILQSVEVLKLLTSVGSTMHDRLVMYDSLHCSFMKIKKPPKNRNCAVCGEEPTILSMNDSQDVTECVRGPAGTKENGRQTVKPTISGDLSISCSDYQEVRSRGEPHVLLDVRVKQQYDMCSLDGAINIPLVSLAEKVGEVEELSGGSKPVYCVCRRGIFSVEAAQLLVKASKTHPLIHSVKNITGGLAAWSTEVDPSFPKY